MARQEGGWEQREWELGWSALLRERAWVQVEATQGKEEASMAKEGGEGRQGRGGGGTRDKAGWMGWARLEGP